ncbi:ankyrin repeat domain-containing protein, partial [Aspergillus homomorphus CBS 101889]
PLFHAVYQHKAAMVTLLIGHPKIDVNRKNGQSGDTALHLAVLCCLEGIASILLEHEQVDVNSRDRANRTPLHIAAQSRSAAVVELLLKNHKIDLNALDLNAQSPLDLARESE